jgi:hypothetical protein
MRIWIAIGLVLALACNGDDSRECTNNDDCLQGGVSGTCLPSPYSVKSWCAFPDPECLPSGQRWGLLAGDGLASACVESTGPDASTIDARLIDAVADATQTDAEPLPDTGAPDAGAPDANGAGCPADMVYVPTADVCIDRYEASQGEGGVAESVALVTAWVYINWNDAKTACEAAGKRLCEEDEWIDACSGPAPGTYWPYGDYYEPDYCNGKDHGVGAAVPTGSMATCEGGFAGIFDMSGNVREWTATCNGTCRVHSGSFYFIDSLLLCSSGLDNDPSYEFVSMGFRCCRAP